MFGIYRCSGGSTEYTWEFIMNSGVVTGGQFNSEEV